MQFTHWFGWVFLWLAIASTLGAITDAAQSAVIAHARIGKGLEAKIAYNYVVCAILITLTLLCVK